MRVALRGGSGTAAQLADRAGMPAPQARNVLSDLFTAGEVERWKRPGTRAWIWRLEKSGG
jgi:predicted ArsR family transcriptional regulator